MVHSIQIEAYMTMQSMNLIQVRREKYQAINIDTCVIYIYIYIYIYI